MLIGHKILLFESLPSTNDYALELLKNTSPEEGTIIKTNNQYAGKGQKGNNWSSTPYENLTISIILFPEFLPSQRIFLLNKAVACAVCQTLQKFTDRSMYIKWPNDILSDQKKLGGVLIENSLTGKKIISSVIGIGLNINQTAFPQILKASSLRLLNGHASAPAEVEEELYRQLQSAYDLLKKQFYDHIESTYDSMLFGKEYHYPYLIKATGEQIQALVEGVNDQGEILLADHNKRYRFGFKEIELIR